MQNPYSGEMNVSLAGVDYKLTITNKTLMDFSKAANVGVMAYFSGAIAAVQKSAKMDAGSRLAYLTNSIDERVAAEMFYQFAKPGIAMLERCEIEDAIIKTGIYSAANKDIDEIYAIKVALVAAFVLIGDGSNAEKKM